MTPKRAKARAPRSTPDAPAPMRPVRRPYAHAVAAARDFCAPFGMRDPHDVDLEALAMTRDAIVVPRNFARGEGHLLRDRASGRALIVVKEDVRGTPKERFVIAHELGHLLLHEDLDDLPRCTGDVAKLAPGARRAESEASDAGCEITMPEAWFTRKMDECASRAPTLDELRAMASYFRGSLTATALRALVFARTPSAFVVSKQGRVAWCACSEGWDVYIHRRAPLHERTAAHAAGRGVDTPREGIAVDGKAWGDARGDVELREWALHAASEDVVLSWMTRTASNADVDVRARDPLLREAHA